MVEFKSYHSFSNVYLIDDNELKEYLSDMCKLKYIIELGFITKADIMVHYNNIFNENNIDKYNIYHQLLLLKESFINSEKPKIINYNQHYGC